jgi:hypothetical protein
MDSWLQLLLAHPPGALESMVPVMITTEVPREVGERLGAGSTPLDPAILSYHHLISVPDPGELEPSILDSLIMEWRSLELVRAFWEALAKILADPFTDAVRREVQAVAEELAAYMVRATSGKAGPCQRVRHLAMVAAQGRTMGEWWRSMVGHLQPTQPPLPDSSLPLAMLVLEP